MRYAKLQCWRQDGNKKSDKLDKPVNVCSHSTKWKYKHNTEHKKQQMKVDFNTG